MMAKSRLSNDELIVKTVDALSKMDPSKIDYLQHIHQPQGFTDVYNALKQNKKRTYYAVENKNLLLDKEQVTKLFSSITDNKEAYDLFNALILSKEYCHLVVNNETVLKQM